MSDIPAPQHTFLTVIEDMWERGDVPRVPVSRCPRIGPHTFIKQFHPLAREEVQWRCAVCNALQEVSE